MSKKPKAGSKADPKAAQPVDNPDLLLEDEKVAAGMRQDLAKLVEDELAVEKLTASKAAFLRAWLKDDVHRAEEYLEDLGGELKTLEERTGDWLLDAADPTKSAWPALMYCIRHGEPWALAGEDVGEGEELQCLGCGYRALPDTGTQITPCHRCGFGCFRQVSGGLEES
ncbi:zinc ribbon-containing protein [Microbulbifer mangrovi]|uniref:zinc ribbon-containing protein n=1 Tax=Microbulbifer mangrovi TaxID=927787 RepID=UPI001EFB5501|nr:zinc ribbon-containing protein [Microbulbifer mangrovi]